MGSAMTLIVLTAICFLACALYVYVLIHWMRDTKRKRATQSVGENKADENREPKRPHIIGSRMARESHGRFAARSLRHASRQGERAVARPLAIRAKTMHTKRSRERGARAGESHGASLSNATCDTSHFLRAMSS